MEKAGLSPFECVTVPDGTFLGVITHLASAVGLEPNGTTPESWCAAARNTGTHTLKFMDSKIGGKNTDAWIFDPDPGCAPTTRTLRTYAYDSKFSKLAKILLVPFVTAGANEALVLIDVLTDRSTPSSHAARAAFALHFGADALTGFDRGLAQRATASGVRGAASLKARTVYVPAGDGAYVLVTPVMSTDAYVALTRLRERMQERGARIGLHRTKLSGKAQNVSLHAGARAGILTRLRARAPEPELHRPATLRRFLASGNPALVPQVRGEIESRLEKIARLLSVMDGVGSHPGYTNANIQEGLEATVHSLAGLAEEHVQDLLEEAARFGRDTQTGLEGVHLSLRPALFENLGRAKLATDLARQVVVEAAHAAARGRKGDAAVAARTKAAVFDIRVTTLLEREFKRLTSRAGL